jgi:hypothetical protein
MKRFRAMVALDGVSLIVDEGRIRIDPKDRNPE